MTMIREAPRTDEPCPAFSSFKIDKDTDTDEVVARVNAGDAVKELRFKITEAYDAGTASFGKSGSTTLLTPVINLAAYALNEVVVVPVLEEFEDATDIIVTLTGAPTTGEMKGVIERYHEFDKAV